jgi:hypothetical protein
MPRTTQTYPVGDGEQKKGAKNILYFLGRTQNLNGDLR